MKDRVVHFGKYVILIKEYDISQINITDTTPQINFLKSHKADIEKECGAVMALSQYLKKHANIQSYFDAMAGCGFTCTIVKDQLKLEKLYCNDLDPLCCEILRTNFPKDQITNENFFELKYPKGIDITSVDFNNFTLKRVDFWKSGLEKIDSPYLVFADSACFGFKFGDVNFKSYGISCVEDYYQKLSDWLFDFMGYSVHCVFPFGNAALVLTKKGGSVSDIRHIVSKPIKMEIRFNGGFVKYDPVKRNII